MIYNDIHEYLNLAINATLKAGKMIMEVYQSGNLGVEQKIDLSPVTIADKAASKIIEELLQSSGLPYLSEEEIFSSFEDRNKWGLFWCVDPLDGTKEFIRKSQDFTVNIALIDRNMPVLGVVYLPAFDCLYFGGKGISARKYEQVRNASVAEIIENSLQLPIKQNHEKFVLIGSHSHLDEETKAYFETIFEEKGRENVEILIRGSSLKMCLMAEGTADFYPRLSHIMEWDIAAGHAICEAAGCNVTDWYGNQLIYNKTDFYMPWFRISRTQPHSRK
jgi:3'(2'), 5'-bisphosphate nucleotidase